MIVLIIGYFCLGLNNFITFNIVHYCYYKSDHENEAFIHFSHFKVVFSRNFQFFVNN